MAVTVAPSILAADFAALGAEVRAVTEAGADWIHLDVMDGHFVPNLTIGPAVVSALRGHCALPFDVHLMIEPVDAHLEAFAAAGADTITVHAEACRHLDRTLSAVRALGVGAGVALNPASPPEMVDWVLDRVDLVLVMSVNPGFGGQSFIASAVDKVARLAERLRGRDVRLEVDGGVSPATIGPLVDAGADVVVAGSAVFGSSCGDRPGDPGERVPVYRANITALREAAGAAPRHPVATSPRSVTGVR